MSTSVPADRLHAALRALVLEAGNRRRLPTHFRIGEPGGPHRALPHDPAADLGLRTDLVEQALDCWVDLEIAPVAWMTRSGDLAATDADLAWLAAARIGYARHGLALPTFHVFTRCGWRDLISGEEVSWRRFRIRDRPSALAAAGPER